MGPKLRKRKNLSSNDKNSVSGRMKARSSSVSRDDMKITAADGQDVNGQNVSDEKALQEFGESKENAVVISEIGIKTEDNTLIPNQVSSIAGNTDAVQIVTTEHRCGMQPESAFQRKFNSTAALRGRKSRSIRTAKNIKRTFMINSTSEDEKATAEKIAKTNGHEITEDEAKCQKTISEEIAATEGQRATTEKALVEKTAADAAESNVEANGSTKTFSEHSDAAATASRIKSEDNDTLKNADTDDKVPKGVAKFDDSSVMDVAAEQEDVSSEDIPDLVIDESYRNEDSPDSDMQSDCEPTLQVHELALHYKCGQCAETFDTVAALQTHKDSEHHTPGKTFQCNQCHREFRANYRLLVHKRSHTGERPFHCADCNASFMTKQVLENHIRIHLGDRPFKCTTCDASFIQKAGLRRHMYIHTSSRPHQCDICNASFPTKLMLDKHLYTHDCDKPVKKCHTCDLEFATSSELRRHSGVHLDRKTYKCEVCEATFALSKTLRNHMRKHGNAGGKQKPYVCEVCQKDFTRDSDLSRHKKMVHVVRSNEKCCSPSPKSA